MLDGFNIGFTAVFLLECILKLIAFKPKVRVIDTVVHSHYKAGVGEGGGGEICRPGTDSTCVALTRGVMKGEMEGWVDRRNSVGSIIK